MKKRYLILFLALLCFSVPCFASEDIPSSDSLPYYLHYVTTWRDEKTYHILLFDSYTEGSLKNFTHLYSAENVGSPNFSTFTYYDSGCFSLGAISNSETRYYTNCPALESDLKDNILGTWDATLFYQTNVPVPPMSAPVVEYSLSTESVLTVILQLIPIILVFLALYWGFWKAWQMLLRILGNL